MSSFNPRSARRRLMYQAMPASFSDSNGDGIGDLQGITNHLEYLQWLGVESLWLGPIFDSPLADGGYDVRDYEKILPAFGTSEDFETLTSEAHERGIKIIIDLPLNHTSITHELFKRSQNREEGYEDFYHWEDDANRYPDAEVIFPHEESSNWEFDPIRGQYYLHRFLKHQADLNYDNRAVQEMALDVIRFWKSKGVDGFRLDAVPYLFKKDGTDCAHLPETHEFLQRIRREVGDETILLAEADGAPDKVAAYVNDGTECNMAFNFPLMPQLFLAIARGKRVGLDAVIKATPPIAASSQWGNFLRNHDELTTINLPAAEQAEFAQAYAQNRSAACMWTERGELRGIRARLAELLDGDDRKIEVLSAVQFALPGTPVLYYGDEIGMGDNPDLRSQDRDQVRTPMQWSAEHNGGFSTAPPTDLHLPTVPESNQGFHFTERNVQDQRAFEGSLLSRIQRMISTGNQHAPIFNEGGYRPVNVDNPAVFAFTRELDGEAMLCLANFSGETQRARVPAAIPQALIGRAETIIPPGTEPSVVAHSLDAPRSTKASNGGLRVDLPAYGWSWHHIGPQLNQGTKPATRAALPVSH